LRVRLAVFDLDGTITRRDTLVLYVIGVLKRRPWRWLGLLRIVPSALLFLLGRIDHGTLKASLIKSTLGGCTRPELTAWTERFVPGLVADGLFAQAVRRIEAHREAGDRLILMSASTDLYVPAIGRALGFQEVICTGVEWEGERLIGNLTTPNRRGPEKARCFEALRSRYPDLSTAAYGNAGSDLDHLRLANEGFLVNGSASAKRRAVSLGVALVRWR
jgi:phosphatidylglycerophosphatase C